MTSKKVRVAIIGVGNCASSLVQGIQYYKDAADDAHVPGIMHARLTLPGGAMRLASTALTPNQAFAVGRHALALQFHAEVRAEGFERWLIGHTLEITLNKKPSVEELRRDTAKWAAECAMRGRRLMSEWLDALP